MPRKARTAARAPAARRRRYRRRPAAVPRRRYFRRRVNPVNAMLRSGAATITGHGAYRVNMNSLLMGQDPPIVRNLQKGEGTCVRHREYITDIVSGATGTGNSVFTLQNFILQPGLNTSFPWLSQIAANFQEYEWNGMVFEYKSLSADAVVGTNASGALGDIMQATNYNSGVPNYANKQQMLESEYSSDNKPSESSIHPIECLRSLTAVSSHLYVRTGAVPAGQDSRLYDHANYQIATQGAQATSALLGELWCSYEVTFYKPILGGTASGNDIPTDKFQLTAPSSLLPFGTSQDYTFKSIGGNIVSGQYVFPSNVVQGTFLFCYSVQGTTAAALAAPSIGVSSGLQKLTVWATSAGFDNAAIANAPDNGSTSKNLMLNFIVSFKPGPITTQQTVNISVDGVLPTAPNFGDFLVTQINSAIVS